MIIYPTRRPRLSNVRSPVPAPITMPVIAGRPVTDTDIGLPENPVAQLQAETYLRAVIAHRLRELEQSGRLARAAALAVKENVPTVHVEVDDDSMVLIDPTDRDLSDDELGILRELRRLTAGSARRRLVA